MSIKRTLIATATATAILTTSVVSVNAQSHSTKIELFREYKWTAAFRMETPASQCALGEWGRFNLNGDGPALWAMELKLATMANQTVHLHFDGCSTQGYHELSAIDIVPMLEAPEVAPPLPVAPQLPSGQ